MWNPLMVIICNYAFEFWKHMDPSEQWVFPDHEATGFPLEIIQATVCNNTKNSQKFSELKWQPEMRCVVMHACVCALVCMRVSP